VATFLCRVGRFAYRSRRLVGLVWLTVIVVVGAGAALLSGPTSDSFSIPGTESQRAFDLLDERFPELAADGASARVVFVAPPGETLADPANEEIVRDVLAEIAAAPQVTEVVGPHDSGLMNEDGSMGLAQVGYAVDFFELDDNARHALLAAADTGRGAGLTVEIGGDALNPEDELGSELVGLGVAAVVLLVTFGSLAAAGMPLITGITGVGIGVAAITAATGFTDIGSTAPILATMLGLAVGIDYALFIVSRYRHELAIGRGGAEAAGRAVGTAGSAVVFAGLTVIIALVGLAVVDIPILTEMGLAAALTVGLAVLIALTLLPALCGFAGRRMLSWRLPGLRTPDPEDDTDTRRTMGKRWIGLIIKRPVTVLVAAVVGLGVLAIPLTDLRLGLPDEGYFPEDWTQRKAYDLTAEGFGAGFNGPLMVVVDAAGAADPSAAAGAVAEALGATDGVQLVAPPVVNPAGDTAIITAIPTEAPASEETEQLVDAIRSDVAAVGADAGAAAVFVTGTTAVFIDFSEKMSGALVPYLLVVVGLSIVLLMLVFRSVVVPVKAALGFLLTIAATFGVLVAIFQWGWLTGLLGIDQTGPIFSILPIFIIGVVFGLAMDYQVFLVTRMREEYVHGADAKTAVTVGFRHGSRVVAAAAIIMISVFAGFALGDADDVAQVGIALAVAIAVDAFVVRMTIVPTVLALVGDRAWWLPRWLDRLLPDVDGDGEHLARYLGDRDREPVAVP
jgi:putative drug exporter of the RND superfamily